MSLEDIAKEARAAAAENAPLPDPPPAVALPGVAQVDPLEAEAVAWAKLPAMFGGILATAMPELKATYTEAACLEWGKGMAPVARKHGWTLGGFEVYLGLASATWALAVPTFEMIKRKRAANERKPAPEPGEAAPRPSAETPASANEFGRLVPDDEAGYHPDGSPKS